VHLADEELEEAFELGRVPAQARRQCRRIDPLCRLERPDLDLELVAEPLDASEHADRVARLETSVEQVDVVPDPGADPATRVDELEGRDTCRRSATAVALSAPPRRRPQPCGSPRAPRSQSPSGSFAWWGNGDRSVDGGCYAPEQAVRCLQSRHPLLARQLRRVLARRRRSRHGRADPGGRRPVRPLGARGSDESAPCPTRAHVRGHRRRPFGAAARRRPSSPPHAGSKARCERAAALDWAGRVARPRRRAGAPRGDRGRGIAVEPPCLGRRVARRLADEPARR